jgi:hypothetical protein
MESNLEWWLVGGSMDYNDSKVRLISARLPNPPWLARVGQDPSAVSRKKSGTSVNCDDPENNVRQPAAILDKKIHRQQQAIEEASLPLSRTVKGDTISVSISNVRAPSLIERTGSMIDERGHGYQHHNRIIPIIGHIRHTWNLSGA